MDCTHTTILVVDEDQSDRNFLAENLTADGYEVLEAGTMAAAERLLGSGTPDLAIIDLGLPDGDGLELLALVRDAGEGASRINSQLPLILTAGASTTVDRVRGFERGCDDFVPRPYQYPELRARVAALLRRHTRPPGPPRVRVGPLEVDVLGRRAWLDGERLELSSKEFGLLRALAADPERAFTRAELLSVVWGWEECSASKARTRTLDSHASRLRRKLSGDEHRFVINVWGIGYRLIDGVPAGR